MIFTGVSVNLPKENLIFSFLPHKSISVSAIPSLKSETQSNELHAYTGIKSVTSLPASASSLETEYATLFTPPASASPAHSIVTVQNFILIYLEF